MANAEKARKANMPDMPPSWHSAPSVSATGVSLWLAATAL